MKAVRATISVPKMRKTITYWTSRGYVKKVVPISEAELKRRGIKL